MNQAGFVLKVVVASTAIAYLIKYLGPLLPIPATPSVALGIVLLPALIMAGVLSWAAGRQF